MIEQPPDPEEARRRYRRLAARYDRRIRVIAPLRRLVVRQLRLQRGGHVLDVGCGTGASFPALWSAVGESGRITGIELSEEMAAVARRRASEHGWTNVDIVVGDAATAPLPDGVDGILFFLTHDLLRSPDTLARIVGCGRSGARVVALGPVLAPRWAAPVNLAVRAIARPYVTTFEGMASPWSHLAELVPNLRVRKPPFGGVYLAVGRLG